MYTERGVDDPDPPDATFEVLEGVLKQIVHQDPEPDPGEDGHRKTITPFHGVIEDPGEYGYRRVPIHVDEHDPSHDFDDRYDSAVSLTRIFRR